MSIKELIAVVPPLRTPPGVGTESAWVEVEQALGTRLPDDYKEMINIYGTGCFGEYIYPYNPFSTTQNLVTIAPAILKIYDQGRLQAPSYHCPLPSYPTSGGLLPWGTGEDSELLCWRTEGPANRWSIVVLDNHYSEQYFEYGSSLTEFLAEWLSGKLYVDVFPDDIEFPPKFVTRLSS